MFRKDINKKRQNRMERGNKSVCTAWCDGNKSKTCTICIKSLIFTIKKQIATTRTKFKSKQKKKKTKNKEREK